MILLTILETTKTLNVDTSVLLALIPGVLALIISITNAFRINRVKKLHEVDLVNHKEDVNLSMEGVKVSLAKEINKLKKGANKNHRANKQKQSTNTGGNDKGNTPNKDKPKKVVQRKPQQRSKNYRKRPTPRKDNPQENQKQDQENK